MVGKVKLEDEDEASVFGLLCEGTDMVCVKTRPGAVWVSYLRSIGLWGHVRDCRDGSIRSVEH